MSRAGFRVAARIGWRQARLSPARSILIATVVALPVAVFTLVGTLIASSFPTTEERVRSNMGSAELLIGGSSTDYAPADVHAASERAALPEGTRLISGSLGSFDDVRGGRNFSPVVISYDVPIDEAPLAGMYRLEEGEVASAPGEVTVHPGLLRELELKIGDLLAIDAGGLSLTIVGTAVRPLGLWEQMIIAGPGTLEGVEGVGSMGWVVDLPDGADAGAAAARLKEAGITEVRTRAEVAAQIPPDSVVATTAAFGGAIAGLFAMGLIAAAAFVVGTRRQLRVLGLIAAAGGEPRHVRATVLGTGASLGFAGSLVGGALGVGLAMLVLPVMPNIIGHDTERTTISAVVILGAIALGTVAATLAAAGPARAAARLSTLDALASRTPAPPPAGRLSAFGGIAIVFGAAAMAWGTIEHQKIILTVGLLSMVGGALLAIPMLVTWVGRGAHVLPLTWRLAARDTARQGRRTGAAIAAATIALTFPIAVGALTQSEEAFANQRPPMSAGHAIVFPADPRDEVATARLVRAYRQAFPEATVAQRQLIAFDPERYRVPPEIGSIEHWTAWVTGGVREIAPGEREPVGGEAAVLQPGLLEALDITGVTPRDDVVTVVGLGNADNGTVRVTLPAIELGVDRHLTLPAVEIDAPKYHNEIFPTFIIPPTLMAEHGMEPYSTSALLLRNPTGLDNAAVDLARRTAEAHEGTFVTTLRDASPNLGGFRTVATGAAALIGLAIVSVAVALVSAESRRDRAIMTAVGSRPRTRRRMAAASAALVALLAGVLAIPAGFAPVAVIQVARQAGHPIVVPWVAIIVVGVVVPLFAGAVAALAARRPNASAMLRPAS